MDEKSAYWRTKLSKGHALGVSCHESFGTAVACAVDVSVENNRPRMHRVTIGIDPGVAANPLTIESQFQGGVTVGVTQLMAKGALRSKMVAWNSETSMATLPPLSMTRRRRSMFISCRAAKNQRGAANHRFLSFLQQSSTHWPR